MLLQFKIKNSYCNIFQNVIYIASLLQSSVSHDPSEIILICWFAAQETSLIMSVKNVVLLHIFVEKTTTTW